MKYDPHTGRYAVCIVGEGCSVEDRRTGERVGWYPTAAAAIKAKSKLEKTR